MVDRCAFVKMLLKSRADSTAKKYLVEIRRFLPGAGRTLLLTVIRFPYCSDSLFIPALRPPTQVKLGSGHGACRPEMVPLVFSY